MMKERENINIKIEIENHQESVEGKVTDQGLDQNHRLGGNIGRDLKHHLEE